MNRTQFRRQHHAVLVAIENLGQDVLFPTKITMKSPQINFVVETTGGGKQQEKPKIFKRSDRSFSSSQDDRKSGRGVGTPTKTDRVADKLANPRSIPSGCWVTPTCQKEIVTQRNKLKVRNIPFQFYFQECVDSSLT